MDFIFSCRMCTSQYLGLLNKDFVQRMFNPSLEKAKGEASVSDVLLTLI